LMGMELGLAVEEAFEVKLSVMAIAEGASVTTLAGRIVDSIGASADAGCDVASAADAAQEAVAALAAKHAIDGEARAMLDAQPAPVAEQVSPSLEVAR
ncbi:hypothetical protein M3570_21605, partial [Bacillus subtilis]|nr:hypothetical protein [Bacillus subtilis]